MNIQFDELTKSMAQSVTRRAALKKFGVGLAGIALSALGLSNTAQADRNGSHNPCNCKQTDYGCSKRDNPQQCYIICSFRCNPNPLMR